MRIDYRPPRPWEKFYGEWAQNFGFSGGFAQVHEGVSQALMEVGLGLARCHSHKKRVYYFKNLNPHFTPLIKVLAREGYEVRELTLEEMISPQGWVDQVERKDLFVLYSVDDPLLGRLYPTRQLEEALRDKKIFKICLSHHWHNYEDSRAEYDDYKVSLYSVSSGQCLSHLGSKASLGGVFEIPWGRKASLQGELEFGQLVQDKERILKFESASSGLAPLGESERVFDRGVLCWEDIDGLALLDQVGRDMGCSIKPPGEDERFETTSLSRWGSEESMSWLGVLGILPNQGRGLVIFSSQIIDDSFVGVVESAREKVLNRQLGSEA